jgi:hypothetical protein
MDSGFSTSVLSLTKYLWICMQIFLESAIYPVHELCVLKSRRGNLMQSEECRMVRP